MVITDANGKPTFRTQVNIFHPIGHPEKKLVGLSKPNFVPLPPGEEEVVLRSIAQLFTELADSLKA